MTTARRRPLEPDLTWPSGGPGRQYRVAVRNEETGEQRTIYDGTRTTCRLPADFRLSPDQLAYRVESRLADDTYAPFRRQVDYSGIDRMGDDFETPAPDLIVAEPREGASAYRLVIRDRDRRDTRLADFQRAEPRFLLPPGRLGGVNAEYAVLSKVGDRFAGGKWRPVTAEMISAAEARAERLIEVPREPSPRDAPNDATEPPGRIVDAAERLQGRHLLIAVDVTAAPLLASAPDPARVAAEQWTGGEGESPTEAVATALGRDGLRGVFFIDVEAAAVFGREAMTTLAGSLGRRGHAIELFHDPGAWRLARDIAEDETAGAAVERAVATFAELVGRPPRLARLAGPEVSVQTFRELRRLGVGGAVVRPLDQLDLPRWMHGRVRAFAALDDFVVVPVTTVVSTPAHVRDRVIRHELGAADALVAGTAEAVAGMVAARGDAHDLLCAHIDPRALWAVQRTVNPTLAERWNAAVRGDRPDWLRAGWMRGEDGYNFADGRSEVALDILANFSRGLGAAGVTSIGPEAVTASALAGWAGEDHAWDALVELRRGARQVRVSAVRRYDNAYRQALMEARA